jgi:hypothetical protein
VTGIEAIATILLPNGLVCKELHPTATRVYSVFTSSDPRYRHSSRHPIRTSTPIGSWGKLEVPAWRMLVVTR